MKKALKILMIILIVTVGTTYAHKSFEIYISKISVRDYTAYERDLSFNIYYVSKERIKDEDLENRLREIDLNKKIDYPLLGRTEKTDDLGLTSLKLEKKGMYLIVDNNDGQDASLSVKNACLVYIPLDVGNRIVIKPSKKDDEIDDKPDIIEDKDKKEEEKKPEDKDIKEDKRRGKDVVKTGDYFIKYMINIFLLSLILLILLRNVEGE